MKTPKINRDEVRESTFTVTATRAEKEAIQRMADKSGLTMSAWVRMVLNEKINQK
jgi:antitoxin component of RelBE/YafQ-DinJ toxin-antitoxin module